MVAASSESRRVASARPPPPSIPTAAAASSAAPLVAAREAEPPTAREAAEMFEHLADFQGPQQRPKRCCARECARALRGAPRAVGASRRLREPRRQSRPGARLRQVPSQHLKPVSCTSKGGHHVHGRMSFGRLGSTPICEGRGTLRFRGFPRQRAAAEDDTISTTNHPKTQGFWMVEAGPCNDRRRRPGPAQCLHMQHE
jgi:hypothetical protein